MSAGLYEQIKADLGYLKLDAAAGEFATLAEEARTHDWTHIEFLARLAATQATHDRDRRLAARLRYARFPYRRTIGEFDFEFQPSIDRKLLEDLATLRFINENRPILFLGQPGCGKTHLAVALATLAVEAGYRGYFTTADQMCATLIRAEHDGNLPTKLKAYTAPTILVIDDVGLLPVGGTVGAAMFFHVVNTRYEKVAPHDRHHKPGPARAGDRSSATPSSPPRSSTGSCTKPSSSTSAAHPGDSESTTASRSPPPNPTPTDNLTPPTSPAPTAEIAEHGTRLLLSAHTLVVRLRRGACGSRRRSLGRSSSGLHRPSRRQDLLLGALRHGRRPRVSTALGGSTSTLVRAERVRRSADRDVRRSRRYRC